MGVHVALGKAGVSGADEGPGPGVGGTALHWLLSTRCRSRRFVLARDAHAGPEAGSYLVALTAFVHSLASSQFGWIQVIERLLSNRRWWTAMWRTCRAASCSGLPSQWWRRRKVSRLAALVFGLPAAAAAGSLGMAVVAPQDVR